MSDPGRPPQPPLELPLVLPIEPRLVLPGATMTRGASPGDATWWT